MEVAPVGNTKPATLLQISGMIDDISISEISDEIFSEVNLTFI